MVARNLGSLELTVNKMVKQLSNAYVSIIKSKAPLKNFPSVMLWGPPGVGKSQGIRQVAKEIAEKTGKKEDQEKYVANLLGRINYVLSVEPDNKQMKQYRSWLKMQ